MSTLKGTRTEQNLLKSFAGESQARSRYTFFAEVAKKEGYEQIAAVFIETAEQEREHAKRFFNFLEGGDLERLWYLITTMVIIMGIWFVYNGIMLLFNLKAPKWKPGLVLFIAWLFSLLAIAAWFVKMIAGFLPAITSWM